MKGIAPGRRIGRVPRSVITSMRSFFVALVALAAVFVMAPVASAQTNGTVQMGPWQGRATGCFELAHTLGPVTYVEQALRLAPKGEAKQPELSASVLRTRPGPEARAGGGTVVPAGQSRAPVLCSDPTQPGCQIEMPDQAPQRGSWGAVGDFAALGANPFDTIEPPGGDAIVYPDDVTSAPREGHLRALWRPPAA